MVAGHPTSPPYLAYISQVPSLAQLRIATTPRSIAGYRYSNEQVQWVGNAALGVCSKMAAVLALGAPPREVRSIFDKRYRQLTSTPQLAAVGAEALRGAVFERGRVVLV